MERRTIVMWVWVACLPACLPRLGCGDGPEDDPPPPPDLSAIDLTPCTRCGDRCVDLFSDPEHCGACGIHCPSGVCERRGNAAFCTCDVDGGSGCESPLMPECAPSGLCTCGGRETSVCTPRVGSTCESGDCQCGAGPSCEPALSSSCDDTQGCRCGSQPQCDQTTASRCVPTQNPPCRCGSAAACAAGSTCCTQNSTCCRGSQYCCIDGCCDHPCLVLGFCAR